MEARVTFPCRCAACGQTIATRDDARGFRAGPAWVIVCAACGPKVRRGAAAAGQVLVGALAGVLRARAPKAYEFAASLAEAYRAPPEVEPDPAPIPIQVEVIDGTGKRRSA